MAKRERTLDEKISRLRTYNVVAGVLHLIQAVGLGYVLTLVDDAVTFAVTADYLGGPPGVLLPPERVEIFDINVGIGVVAFLGMSAFFHFLISSPMFFKRYANGLKNSRNYFRWTEYSLSSSVMIWLIAQITGITDIAALFSIFAVNASMIMFGALQEKYERPGSGGFLPFVFGSMTGLVPWIVILIYFFAPGSTSEVEAPAFVLVIIVSLFVFFNTFAVNQALQYHQVGGWKDYLRGERMYITLSLIAKTVLAYQVFSGAIIPALTA
jgi:hypothetical protein